MKMNIIIVVLSCMILQYVSADNATIRVVGESCYEHGSLLGCSSDCRGRRSCWLGTEIVTDCLAQTGKPYCDAKTNECTNTIPGDCSGTEDHFFICPTVNTTFPYALDCRKFWYCPNNARAKVYECVNSIYDPKNKNCAPSIHCYTFSPQTGLCRNKKNVFVVHPLNKAIYALCNDDEFPQLSECSTNLVFDTQLSRCVHECTQSGNFADPNNKSCYYTCTKVMTYWRSEFHCCEAPLVFNQTLSTCFPE